MSDGLIVKKKLPIGIEVDGKRFRDFSIRPGTLRDSVKAADNIVRDSAEDHFALLANTQVWDGIKPEQIPEIIVAMYKRAQASGGGASANELRYATMAQRVVVEGVPQEMVTAELLMDLFDRDAMALEAASDEVEKKLDELSSS